MFEKLEIFRMASALAKHAGTRQTVIARNIANSDTPGYRAEDVADFAKTYRRSDTGTQMRATRPGHMAWRETAYAARNTDRADPEEPNGNTVSVEDQMVKAVETKRQHDLALAVYRSSLGILRTSLGRQR
ncbi:FlgB family protein [Rhodovulum sulfidophilum]|uniref:FlgB family protein n=1 Tax=Rhodovulum sulfidophilum TaxID=35806 RepID=A0ABS1RWK9_RHOSU|nr:FlgB family protein [Rhodovulum sulfidophilum]MBL3610469.1 FlgB family protein [Rhodovulum sulfidophilum]MCE8456926.1 FlgB family protein [Rhodovulum sulfidophilum]